MPCLLAVCSAIKGCYGESPDALVELPLLPDRSPQEEDTQGGEGGGGGGGAGEEGQGRCRGNKAIVGALGRAIVLEKGDANA